MKIILLAIWLLSWVSACYFIEVNHAFFAERLWLVMAIGAIFGAILGILNASIWNLPKM